MDRVTLTSFTNKIIVYYYYCTSKFLQVTAFDLVVDFLTYESNMRYHTKRKVVLNLEVGGGDLPRDLKH